MAGVEEFGEQCRGPPVGQQCSLCELRAQGHPGLAQVRGYRGATITEVDILNRVNSDIEYLSRWSIWTDIKILVRTMGVMAHRNAF